MSSIQRFDESVKEFVDGCTAGILAGNEEILHAYYDATKKVRTAALEVQQHAVDCKVQLKRLRSVARMYNKGEKSLAVEQLLHQVNVEKMKLPQSLTGKLEEATRAYADVIVLCSKAEENLKKEKTQVNSIVLKVVGLCCLILFGVAVSVWAPPIGFVVAQVGAEIGVSISTSVAVGSVLSAGVAILGLGWGAAAVLGRRGGRRIYELNSLANKIMEQRKRLEQAQSLTEDILSEMLPLKYAVIRVQSSLVETAATSTFLGFKGKDMEEITCDKFLESLDTQVKQLETLSKTCIDLGEKVAEAYELFRRHPGFIRQRVLQNKEL